jgi:hypothetical protein
VLQKPVKMLHDLQVQLTAKITVRKRHKGLNHRQIEILLKLITAALLIDA